MRLKYLPIIMILLLAGNSKAQVKDADPYIYKYVTQMPKPTFDIRQYLKTNVRYPEAAKKNRLWGKVETQFIVNKDGTISDVKVMKGIGSGCDEEAVRVLEHMPKWLCGRRNGVPARVYISLPIYFEPPGDAGNNKATNDGPFIYVDQMPEPTFDIRQYLKANVRYPEMAKKHKIHGRVLGQFVVNKNGTTSDVKVVKGLGGGCDEEAVRVLEHMPKWKCGKQNGVPVRVYINLPIEFGTTAGG